MKLGTFAVATALGAQSRFGVIWPGRTPQTVVDVNAAFAAMASDQGRHRPQARADAFCPPSLNAYLDVHGNDVSLLEEVVDWVVAHEAAQAPNGATLHYDVDQVSVLSPVPHVPTLRDFAAFEDHLHETFGKMGLAIPPAWYEQPLAFKGNASSIVHPESVIDWPAYTEKLDYELEVAAVIGRDGKDIPLDRADEHILGYTLLNDFSARDIQKAEMSNSTGPFKAKDFAWGLGPWIVTPDELGELAALKLEVRVNDDVWVTSTTGEMKWSFQEIVSYTSQGEQLMAGDVIGSGTVNGGCGFEIDRWLRPGDTVELHTDAIGTLRHSINAEKSSPVAWRR